MELNNFQSIKIKQDWLRPHSRWLQALALGLGLLAIVKIVRFFFINYYHLKPEDVSIRL
jgi:hypothetical protein